MLDIRTFLRAIKIDKPLDIQKAEDRNLYIDFSSVRGGKVINRLKNNIILYDNDPTCALFTGHIGCGKSTELLRLRDELEREGFCVVYFESSDDLETNDVEIVDVLLTIARRVAEELERREIQLQPTGLKKFLQDTGKILNAEVTGFKIKPPKLPGVELGDIGASAKQDEFSIAFAIGELTAKVKDDATLRRQMNQYLGPQKKSLMASINRELLEPAIAKLRQQGKKGLTVIVDNLDRIDNSTKNTGKSQHEYLFVDQAQFLQLNCHLVYTIPLGMLFSTAYGNLTQRFSDPSVLPMVPPKNRDCSPHQEGIELLRQMVLARAFPTANPQERLERITEIFESEELLDRLCQISGGHVRDLLMLLNSWIVEDMTLPLKQETFKQVVRSRCNALTRAISPEERKWLDEVKCSQWVSADEGYRKFISSRYVFEYQDEKGSWYDINPILEEG